MSKVALKEACLLCLGTVIAIFFWLFFYLYISSLPITGQEFNWLLFVITFILAVIVFFVHYFLHYKDHSKTDKYYEDLKERALLYVLEEEFHNKELPLLKPNQIEEFLYELEEIFYKSALTTPTINVKHDP